MLRSQRLKTVLALEERKEQEALDRMGEARQQMEAHRDQVANLERYQQEATRFVRTSKALCPYPVFRPGKRLLPSLIR